MHSPLVWIVCTSPIKQIVFSSGKRIPASLLLLTPQRCPYSCHHDSPGNWKTNYERERWDSRTSKSSASNIHTGLLRWGKALPCHAWQKSYLIIASEYKHWSKQTSLLRKYSSYSGWPVRNKQFCFFPIATLPHSQLLLVRARWSRSPTC